MNIAPEVRYRLYQNGFDLDAPSLPLTVTAGAVVQPLTRVTENGNSFVRSTGPWWPDPNHIGTDWGSRPTEDQGAGWLHLIAYDYFRHFAGSSGVMGGRYQSIDLSGATYSFRVKLDDVTLPEGAHLVFWFQAIDPNIAPEQGQYVNYVNTMVHIDEIAVPGEWTTITITLTDDDSDWLALGTSRVRNNTYSASESIAHALSTGQPVDAGIIMFLGNDYTGAEPATGSISFDDFLFVAPASVPDVIYDGLLHNPATGEVRWYDAYGTGGSAFTVAGSATADWKPVSVKYFAAGDTQIVWRHANSATYGYWNIVDGKKAGGYVSLGSVPQSYALQAPADSSDVDGDGDHDFVWRDTATGTVSTWLMEDGAIIAKKTAGRATFDWQIVATGDVTGDGVDDLLWHSAREGRTGWWHMLGGEKQGPFNEVALAAGRTPIGLGDFRGDGSADILWHDSATGEIGYANFVGGAVQGSYSLGNLAGGWEVAAIRDIDGDGSADLLLSKERADPAIGSHELVNSAATTVTSEGGGVFRIRKTGGDADSFDASAVSTIGYGGDFRLSAASLSGTPDFHIGMNSDPGADDGDLTLDYSVQVYGDGRGYLHENGKLVMSFQIDGQVWMWRDGTTLKLGTGPDFQTASTAGVVRTITGVTTTLYFDSSFKSATSDVRVTLEGLVGDDMVYWALEDARFLGSVPEASPLRQGLPDSSDMDGDGDQDVVRRDPVTGAVTIGLVENGIVVAEKAIGSATLDWQMVGTGDVTGDGVDDILWFSEAGSRAGYWQIVGGQRVGGYRDLDRGGGDAAVGIGDFLGDGSADILWRDPVSGELSFTNVVGGVSQGRHVLGVLDPAWTVAGVGDINGDGVDDLLLEHATAGEMMSWIVDMNPVSIVSVGNGVPGFDFLL